MISLKPVGYWRSKIEPHLPHPGDFVDENLDPEIQDLLVRYLLISDPIRLSRGVSPCRFHCPYPTPGTSDNTDGEYIFPSGFIHYVGEHHVRPPEEFIQKVLKNTSKIIQVENDQQSIVKKLLREQKQKEILIKYSREEIFFDWEWWISFKK